MNYQKTSGFCPKPSPIFTDAIEFTDTVLPNPKMEWKFNDTIIVPLTAIRKDDDPSFMTEGVFVGVHANDLVLVRLPVQTTWGAGQSLYVLDRKQLINVSAYERNGQDIAQKYRNEIEGNINGT